MKAPTIYDVARLAGVSHQTVTRFLRGYEGIRPETRQRVEAALAELDYRPNAAARMLRSKRTNRIGVLADRLDKGGPAQILGAAGAVAQKRGYVLDIVTADGSSAGSVAASLATLIEHQVAGIIATAQTQVVLDELARQVTSTPLLLSPEPGAQEAADSPNHVAGRLAADHLMDLGHHRVGYLAGPSVWLSAQARADAFLHRVGERGGEVAWVREGDWSPGSGYAVWGSLNTAEQQVTAVAAANDSMAVGIIAAADERGRKVPETLSVIGTDDLPESRYGLPSLSTVVMDFAGEGRFLVEELIFRIEGAAGHQAPTPAAAPRLEARRSTVRPATRT